MKKLALIFAALLFASPALAAEDCALKQLASLDMTRLPNGEIAVPVEIMGTKRNFAVELGIAHTFVTQSVLDELKLQAIPLPNYVRVVTGGVAVTGRVKISPFKIGTVSGNDVDMLVLPQMAEEQSGVSGMLGMDLLSTFDAEFDFKNAKLNLFSSDHCPGAVVYWASSGAAAVAFERDKFGFVTFKMQLDSEPVQVQMSTTAAHGSMTMMRASKLFGIDVQSPDIRVVSRDTAGNPAVYRYPFKTLSIDGVAVNNPIVDIDPNETSCDRDTRSAPGKVESVRCYGTSDIQFGLTELQSLHLYFAFKEKELYVTAADAHR